MCEIRSLFIIRYESIGFRMCICYCYLHVHDALMSFYFIGCHFVLHRGDFWSSSSCSLDCAHPT